MQQFGFHQQIHANIGIEGSEWGNMEVGQKPIIPMISLGMRIQISYFDVKTKYHDFDPLPNGEQNQQSFAGLFQISIILPPFYVVSL